MKIKHMTSHISLSAGLFSETFQLSKENYTGWNETGKEDFRTITIGGREWNSTAVKQKMREF